jgi:hypothetical protein
MTAATKRGRNTLAQVNRIAAAPESWLAFDWLKLSPFMASPVDKDFRASVLGSVAHAEADQGKPERLREQTQQRKLGPSVAELRSDKVVGK